MKSRAEDQASGPRHPMGVVSERTGLTPDVIRVWERRYGVVDPERDDGGNRLYTDADVARLELLARAVEGGRSIGRIARLEDDAVAALVREDTAARFRAGRSPAVASPDTPGGARGPERAAAVVEAAMERVRSLDAGGLEETLERALTLMGVESFLEGVAAPLFRRIGDEWHAGMLGVAPEHMASGVMVPLLGRVRRGLPAADDAPLMAVATPAGERHEVGALLVAAVTAAAGWRVLYLGADLPVTEIAAAVRSARAGAVALSVVAPVNPAAVVEEIAALVEAVAPAAEVLVGGAASAALRAELAKAGAVSVDGLDGLRSYLGVG